MSLVRNPRQEPVRTARHLSRVPGINGRQGMSFSTFSVAAERSTRKQEGTKQPPQYSRRSPGPLLGLHTSQRKIVRLMSLIDRLRPEVVMESLISLSVDEIQYQKNGAHSLLTPRSFGLCACKGYLATSNIKRAPLPFSSFTILRKGLTSDNTYIPTYLPRYSVQSFARRARKVWFDRTRDQGSYPNMHGCDGCVGTAVDASLLPLPCPS